MTHERITQSKTAGYRKALLTQQDCLCGLCGHHIEYEKAVLDHCHKSGRIRSVLHRGCNSLLGKIENNYKRFGITLDQLSVIAPTCYEYMNRDYSHNPYHYSHKPKPVKPCRAKK